MTDAALLADVMLRGAFPDKDTLMDALWEASFGIASGMLKVPPMVAQTWAEQASSLLGGSL